MSRPKTFCTVDACDSVHYGRGYCLKHYARWRKFGDPLKFIFEKAPASDRFWAKVAKAESCWQWTGSLNNNGYGQFWDGYGYVLAHRFSYGLVFNLQRNQNLDHVCRNRSCVNPDHLRPVTHKQNSENLGLRSNNRSGFRGVSWSSGRGKWLGRVVHHGHPHDVGYFDDAEEANIAVVAKRNELFTNNVLDRTL